MAEITLKIETKEGVGIEQVTEALNKLGFVVSVTPLPKRPLEARKRKALTISRKAEASENKAIVRAIRAAETSPLVTKEKLLSIFE